MADKYDLGDDMFDEVSDDYFDDEKLDRMLDEIAELKKTIRDLPEADDAFSSGYDEARSLDGDVRLAKTTQKLRRDIRRLSDRITDMQDERVGSELMSGDVMDRLAALGEQLTSRLRETEHRLEGEIGALKKQLSRLASSDITGALNKIGDSVKNAEEMIVSINGAVENLTSAAPDEKKNSPDTELMRHIFDLKRLVGNPSALAEKRNAEIFTLYEMLAALRGDVRSDERTMAEKLTSLGELAARLKEAREYDVAPLVDGFNALAAELMHMPLTSAEYESVMGMNGSAAPQIAPSRREAVKSYLDSVADVLRDGSVENLDDLPDIIALKNNLQGSRNEFACETIYSEVLNTNIALLGEKDAERRKALEGELMDRVRKLTALEMCDLIDYPVMPAPKPLKPSRRTDGGLFDKINELKGALLDSPVPPVSAVRSAVPDSEADAAEPGEVTEVYPSGTDAEQWFEEIHEYCLEILDRLDEKQGYDHAEGAAAGSPTLDEIVAQLDRLFEDFKTVAADSENNITSSLEVLGEAVSKLNADSEARAADRGKILGDVAFLRAHAENGGGFGYTLDESLLSGENEYNATSQSGKTISERLDEIEKNQQAILEALGKLTAADAPNDEMRKLSTRLDTIEAKLNMTEVKDELHRLGDRLFAVSMANVTEGDKSSYQSYNHLILNELYALGDALAGDANKDDLAKLLAEVKAMRADLAKKSAAASKPAARTTAPAAKRPAPKKKPQPSVKRDATASEILSGISRTDVKLDN